MMTKAQHKNEIYFVCPAPANENALQQAVLTLYYLPEQYKLVVLCASPHDELDYQTMLRANGHRQVMDRVVFEADAPGQEDDPLFLRASVILYGTRKSTCNTVARKIMVTPLATNDITVAEDYLTVSTKPEALASAILQSTQ